MAKFTMTENVADKAASDLLALTKEILINTSTSLARMRGIVDRGGGIADVAASLGARAQDVQSVYEAFRTIVSTWSDLQSEDL